MILILGFKEDEKKGMTISFDKDVEKTVSELQINTRTLVTRFGGIIGVGKNLLWFIILGISGIGYCSKKVCRTNREDTDIEDTL